MSCYKEWHEKLIQSIINKASLDRYVQNLRIPTAMLEEYRSLNIAYAFAPDDAVIDVFISYNSLNVEPIITTNKETNLYPLIFPYLGARGTVGEIKTLINEDLADMAIGSLAPILGNEPFDITLTNFKQVSLIKGPAPLKGEGTLIGIIDTGIDYTNPVFIDSNGETRIEYIWDQTIGTSSPYGYGTIYDRATINEALKNPEPSTLVPHKDESGHGTMLAGIAAGSASGPQGNYTGVAPEARFVIVKLVPAVPLYARNLL